jgi:peptide/nickel transport system permease protein
MKTALLVARRVANFLAVLFLSSVVLTGLLWVSPGSPGKAREPLPSTRVVAGRTEACIDRTRCGLVTQGPDANGNVMVRIGTEEVPTVADDLLEVPPTASEWLFVRFWGGVLRWDVGMAYNNEPILDVVSLAARESLPIVAGAILLSVVLSLSGVLFLQWLPFPSMRGVLRTVGLAISIAPVFILGFLLTKAGVLPHPTALWVAPLACVILLSIGDSHLGEMLLSLEDEVRRLRSRDYVHAAVLRGASPLRHMLPGVLLPLFSLIASKAAFLLGSIVIAENIYAVSGIGAVSLRAATKPDPLLLLTLTVLVTGVVAGLALVRDVVEIAVDPRVRRGFEEGS